ncbi:hypothetical protein [Sutcliffiella deserti]|uniref:hypothetical protein n=1 Tax=Sutcliffiella deserti TaxID=2875501 RepID=UPI001CBB4542|nr:hypothetical protein [Sutcliffiella deserti]
MKKYPTQFLWMMMIFSLLTLPFLGWKHFKRFAPSAIFISVFITLEGFLAEKRKWWAIYKKIPPYFINEFAFIAGPFFAATLWTLRLTYGRFWNFCLLNMISDGLFVFPVYNWLKGMGIFSLVKLQRIQLYLIFLFKALLVYAFQTIWERLFPFRNEPLEKKSTIN